MIESLLKPEPIAKLAKLTAAAQHYPCVLCGRDKQYTSPAHNNEAQMGRGAYHKTPSYLVAYVCNVCHDQIDGRAGGLSQDEKRHMWREAYMKTVAIWFRDGWVKVA